MKKFIAKRADGFSLEFASWSDFPKLKKKYEKISDETKKYYSQWMFEKNPGLKKSLGQILARLSLIPYLGNIIKLVFPYGFAFIIKCSNNKGDIVGMGSVYNFKKIPKSNSYVAIASIVIFDEYRKFGLLGIFLMYHLEKIAKQENVTRLRGVIYLDNESISKILERLGWNIVDTEDDMKNYIIEGRNMKEVTKDI